MADDSADAHVGNWGRWGDDDERGAINLIGESKRLEAAACIRAGQSISLSMPLNTKPGPFNPAPVEFELGTSPWGDSAGYAHDRVTLECHDRNITHIDALCHIWDGRGMWGGRQPDVLKPEGSCWADVDAWRDGIVTRGLLLDIPALRGTTHVTVDEPVHGWELDAAARAAGTEPKPGDALCVYGGRAAWEREARDSWDTYPPEVRPGLHASCVDYLRDHDVAVLVWDLVDARPAIEGGPWPVHGALISLGIALVDHAKLDSLVELCRQRDQHTFMLVIAPLRIPGATGSAVNPIAIL